MRREKNGNKDFKSLLYVSAGVLGVILIAFVITYMLYDTNVSESEKVSQLSVKQIEDLVPNTDNSIETKVANNPIGKTVEEAQKNNENLEEAENIAINTSNILNNEATSNIETNVTAEKNNNTNTTTESVVEEKEEQVTESKKDPNFIKPVEGEIIKTFAKDSLIYSETLQEWVVHGGIDIKADKTTVVKASSDGVVKSIKNDPRYGLSIIIEHDNGFITMYSNLLTSEFVIIGENVTQGQSIGTVGNTATFEIVDESHLHFEILKDNEQVDPTIYVQ